MADYKISARIVGDASRFKATIREAKRYAESLRKSGNDVEVDADISRLRAKIQQAKAMMASFKNDKAEVKVDVDAGAAAAQISRIKLMFKSIPNKIRTRVDVDSNPFVSAMNQMIAANDKFDARMDNIASSIRSFGTVIGNQIQGALISSFSAAIPVIAALVPAVMAVGNAIAVVGGGAIGAAGSFMILQGGIYAFAGMATTALKMLKDGTIQASAATATYQNSLAGLKSAWQGVVATNADAIFGAMAKGLQVATSAVQQLTPFLSSVATLVDLNAQKLLNWVNTSSIAKAAFQMLNTTGVGVFANMLSAAGRFGAGLVSLFTQFGPLFAFVSQGLQNMATDFMKWSTSVSTANGIKQFIEYTRTNLPVLAAIFGNVFMGLFNLFAAFGTNSQTIFAALEQMSAKFRAWSETIASSDGFQRFIEYVSTNGPLIISLIGAVVMAVVNFGIAVAPLGAIVLQVITAFTQWIAKLFETNPAIAMLLGVIITLGGVMMSLLPTIIQLGTMFTEVIMPIMRLIQAGKLVATAMQGISIAFTLLTSPIALIIAAIVGLVAVFIYLWTTNEQFRAAVISIWQQIQSFIQTAIQVISSVVMAIWGALVAWWQANQQTIVTAAMTAWNMLVSVVSAVITAVVSFVMAIWGQLVSWWQANNQLIIQTAQTIWGFLAPIISAAIQLVVSIVQTGWQILVTVTQVAFQALVTVVQVVWTVITTAVQVALTILGTIVRVAMQLINGDWQGAWQSLLAAGQAIWQLISSAAIAIFNALVAGVVAIWQTLSSSIGAILTGLVAIISAAWNLIVTVVTSVVTSVVSFVVSGFTALLSGVSSILSSLMAFVASIFASIVAAISSAISSAVSFVSSGFSNMLSTASSIMSSIMSAISSAWSSIISTISSAISSAVSAVTSGFSNMMSAVSSFASNLISSITSAMSSFVSSVTSGASNAVSALTSGLSNMISAAAGFVGDMVAAGTNLIMGMVRGITSAAGNLVSAAVGAVKGAIGAAKAALGIHSPSRVFRSIGIYTMQGATIGIEREGQSTIASTAAMAERVTDAFAPTLTTDFRNIGADLQKATARVGVDTNSSFNQDINVPRSNITVTMDLKNDAIVAMVDEEHADNDNLKKF